ncbi:hypothetical protein AHiyo4_06980 [Arthrobacter sp. Hiyo4]|nr:hypothetical protein AHiyo4_06980 [Arthrobacter sp. Hiyo4]
MAPGRAGCLARFRWLILLHSSIMPYPTDSIAGTAGGADQPCSSLGRSLVAGPSRSLPSGLKREPWSGQSQVSSLSFQWTIPPRWVQTAESLHVVPPTVETAAGRAPPAGRRRGKPSRRRLPVRDLRWVGP